MVLMDIHDPDEDKCRYDHDRQDTEQKDQEAVVSVNGLSLDLLGGNGSQCGELAEIFSAEGDHVDKEQDLGGQEREPFGDLSAHQRAEPEDHIGKL